MINSPLYTDRIMAYADTPFVKVLTGVHGCGKTSILKMLMKRLQEERGIPADRIVSMRLDSMQYDGMTAKEIFETVQGKLSTHGRTCVFLDEVQEITGWEKAVSQLATEYDTDLYVSVSGSGMQSSETPAYLAGRCVFFPVFTLSFAEYLEFKKSYAEVHDVHAELADYVRLGGFPAAHLRHNSQDEVYTLVSDIFRSAVYTDIVKRNRIRKPGLLEQVVRHVFANTGRPISAKAIADSLKAKHCSADNETVSSCLDKLEQACLLHRCCRYDLRGKKILKTRPKFYPADTSLWYSILGWTPESTASALENVVFLELCRRGYAVTTGQTQDGEIDFVARKQNDNGNDRLYVQVTQEISSEKTERREYERLLEIRDNYPKYVLRTDDFAGGNYKGIICMHIADFLLGL